MIHNYFIGFDRYTEIIIDPVSTIEDFKVFHILKKDEKEIKIKRKGREANSVKKRKKVKPQQNRATVTQWKQNLPKSSVDFNNHDTVIPDNLSKFLLDLSNPF